MFFKRVKNLITGLFIQVPEKERRHFRKTILKDNIQRIIYAGILLFFIELIIYILSYNTKAPIQFPLAMILFNGIMLPVFFMLKRKKSFINTKTIFVYLYLFFCIAWACLFNFAAIKINTAAMPVPIYILMVYGIAVYLYMEPSLSIFFFTFSTIFYINNLYIIQPDTLRRAANIWNTIALNLFAWVISRMIFRFRLRTFLDEILIKQKNLELEEEKSLLKERNLIIENDLKLARRIQNQLIPRENISPFISAYYQPMDKVGGDFYDILLFEENGNTGIFLSDVSGHGVPAAFITSMIKTTIHHSETLGEDPASLLLYLNTFMNGKTAGNFITAFYGIYNPQSRTLLFANAGHNPPIIIGNNSMSLLEDAKSLPLLVLNNDEIKEQKRSYTNSSIVLNPGERIIFYTDGLMEQTNQQEIQFEEVLFDGFLKDQSGLAGKEIIKNVTTRLKEWNGSAVYDDDVCILCMEII